MLGLGKQPPPWAVATADACSLPYVLPCLCGSFQHVLFGIRVLGGFASCTPFFSWLVAGSCFRNLYSCLARLLDPAISFLQSLLFHLAPASGYELRNYSFRATDRPASA